MSEHTPGPWRLTRGRVDYDIRDSEGNQLAKVFVTKFAEGGRPLPLPGKANAQIILLAPDFLEVCEAFLKEYGDALDEYHFGNQLDNAFADVVGPMSSLVAKARGNADET